MDKKEIIVGLGGVGKSGSSKILKAASNEIQKHDCLFVDFPDINDVDINFYDIHKVEKTDE